MTPSLEINPSKCKDKCFDPETLYFDRLIFWHQKTKFEKGETDTKQGLFKSLTLCFCVLYFRSLQQSGS